jgi:hypothetical protein
MIEPTVVAAIVKIKRVARFSFALVKFGCVVQKPVFKKLQKSWRK